MYTCRRCVQICHTGVLWGIALGSPLLGREAPFTEHLEDAGVVFLRGAVPRPAVPLSSPRVPIDLLRLQVGVDLLGWGSADSGAVVSPSAQPHLRVFGVRRRRRCEAKLQQPQTSKGLIDFQTCHGWLYNSYPHF